MLDRFKQIPARLLELWGKYTKKQKSIIISVAASVVLALVLLILILGKTDYVPIHKFSDITTARNASQALKDAGIAHKLGNDHLTLSVDAKKEIDAQYIIITDETIVGNGYEDWDWYNNDMSTTNYDKNVKINMKQRNDIESNLRGMEGILDATVIFDPSTDKSKSILEPDKEIVCSVYLTINDSFKDYRAENIAWFVARALGNYTTENIVIIDQYSNLLYNGGKEETGFYGSKRAEIEAETRGMYYDFAVALGMANQFHEVTPALNYVFNFDEVSELWTEYWVEEGRDEGFRDYLERVTSESSGGAGNPVGTDSNDEEPGYFVSTQGVGDSSYESLKEVYLPNSKITNINKAIGNVIFGESSGSIALTQVNQVTRKEVELSGVLEELDMTYEEYMLMNKNPREIEVPQILYEAYSDCTGIPIENLTITAYEKTVFLEDEETAMNWDLILKIILAVLILGMLIFVVFRGMAPVEVTELEPELSVEQLLATTKENQSLDDIDFGEQSETRKMIEKFVDENPEAVANLLRGWLEDDWE